MQAAELASIVDDLPPLQRLAVAYAPARAKPLWLALLALDARLARAARGGQEPLLAQIKLAWWRERLAEPAARRPRGEPLLALLPCWGEDGAALAGLVDAWEVAIGDPADAAPTVVAARTEAVAHVAAVCAAVTAEGAIEAGVGRWSAADFPDLPRLPARTASLPRALRPLAVLAGGRFDGGGAMAFARVVRLGLFGR